MKRQEYLSIDVGTHSMSVAMLDEHGVAQPFRTDDGTVSIISALFINDDGTVVIGKAAVNAGVTDPSRLVKNPKRAIGTSTVLATVAGKKYGAKQCIALLLGTIRDLFQQRTGNLAKYVSLSCPANWDDAQKTELKEAAKEAGFQKIVKIVHEPTACAVGNEIYKLKDGAYAAYDAGGGTLDITVLRKLGDEVEVLVNKGDNHNGGLNFTDRITKHFLDEFEKQHGFRPSGDEDPLTLYEINNRVEDAKHSLSDRDNVPVMFHARGKVYSGTLTRQLALKCTKDLISKGIVLLEEALTEAGVGKDELVEVIPNGGQSKDPNVIQALTDWFGKPVKSHCDPLLAVSLGTCVMGKIAFEREGQRIEDGRGGKLPSSTARVVDRTSHPVGVAVIQDENNPNDLYCSVILAKGKPIPSRNNKDTFLLADPYQTAVRVVVLQGESGAPMDQCTQLGEFELDDLPALPEHQIDVLMDVDEHGMLNIRVKDPHSGKSADLNVNYKRPQRSRRKAS